MLASVSPKEHHISYKDDGITAVRCIGVRCQQNVIGVISHHQLDLVAKEAGKLVNEATRSARDDEEGYHT